MPRGRLPLWAATILALTAAGAAAYGGTQQPVLYEISTRPWLYSLAQSGIVANCGPYVCLRDVPADVWQKIAEDSVDIVWLMGVWSLGDFGLQHDRAPDQIDGHRKVLPDIQAEDVIGSPYAVREYVLNSDIGSGEDLAAVRKTLRSLGMKLMLDFVPNHGAVDSVFVQSSPDAFIQRPSSSSSPDSWWIQRDGKSFAYGRGPYDGPWTDTLQYNYWNPKTVQVLTTALLAVAEHADAVRCDMGMLILNDVIQHTWGDVMAAGGFQRPAQEFWTVAIRAVRAKYPDTLFMAEAYDYHMTQPPEKQFLLNVGFDFVYDKTVLDHLAENNLANLRGYISPQSGEYFSHTAHFVENHDEQRAAAALHGKQQAFAGAVVASTLPGLRLFYFGQLDGFSAKLDVQLRRAASEAPDAALHEQYRKLLAVLKASVFHEGAWTFIQTPQTGSAWRVCAWRWSSADGKSKRLVVINFSDTEAWAKVQVADAQAENGNDIITVRELLKEIDYNRSSSEMRSDGLNVGLEPWTAQIFSYGTASLSQGQVIV